MALRGVLINPFPTAMAIQVQLRSRRGLLACVIRQDLDKHLATVHQAEISTSPLLCGFGTRAKIIHLCLHCFVTSSETVICQTLLCDLAAHLHDFKPSAATQPQWI